MLRRFQSQVGCRYGTAERARNPRSREWNGNTHEVMVGIDYYEYQGRRYASFSSVAKVITGTNWNGWRFFGFMSARGLS